MYQYLLYNSYLASAKFAVIMQLKTKILLEQRKKQYICIDNISNILLHKSGYDNFTKI